MLDVQIWRQNAETEEYDFYKTYYPDNLKKWLDTDDVL